METLIKKVLYTGVGLVANTTEKVQKTVNKTVTNLSSFDATYQKEGKRIVENLFKSTEARKDNIEDKAKDMFESVMARFDLVSKKEYDSLVKKINKLEKSQKATGKSAKSTASKSAKSAEKVAKTTKTAARKVSKAK